MKKIIGLGEDFMENTFDEFWKAYPRHVAKKTAKKAWDKIKMDDVLFRKIIDVVNLNKKSPQWQIPQYIPHAATWLNGERWDDEVDTTGRLPFNDKYLGI